MLSQRTITLVTASLLSIVGILHLLRVIFRWSLVVGNVTIPMWVSYLAVLVLAYLAYYLVK